MSDHAALLRLAREATNGWACYAKRDVEHREIARIHSALDDIDRHDAACETELTSHGYTPCRCAVLADAAAGERLEALARETAEADEAITGTMLAHMPVPEAAAVVRLKCKAQNLVAALRRVGGGPA